MPATVDTARARQLVEHGAQLVDVLPAETFRQEHLPGAVNIPLAQIATAVDRLDRAKPVIVYCYDYQCDLSPRGAVHLERLGFREVYDYVASKAAWLAEGLPGEGLLTDGERAGGHVHADVPRVSPDATMADVATAIGAWELVVVTDDDDVVLGTIRAETAGLPDTTRVTAVMQTGPATVRPSIPVRDLAKSMDENGEAHMLVTTLGGSLVGLVRRADLDAA